MEWTDDGIILAVRKHGENGAIASLLTRDHGRHPGLVRGGTGRKARGVLQPGNGVRATWRGRLPDHLGAYTCELTAARAARVLNDPPGLAGLTATCAMAEAVLPEREAHRPVFEGLSVLLDVLGGDGWASAYVKWELGLLAELGFGLDLARCAATGATGDLTHVSPRTGRAVSRAAAAPYLNVLLPLPPFLLRPGGAAAPAEVLDGLALTAHFLDRHVFQPAGRALPPARRRLADHLGAPRAGS